MNVGRSSKLDCGRRGRGSRSGWACGRAAGGYGSRFHSIGKRIYGQFLEHINHSVVDGLFAEQIRGAGFEGEDFETYWTSVRGRGAVSIVEVVRTWREERADASPADAQASGRAAVPRVGAEYDGSVWIKTDRARRECRCASAARRAAIARTCRSRCRGGMAGSAIRIHEPGTRSRGDGRDRRQRTRRGPRRLRVADARRRAAGGMLRPDLLQALRGLRRRSSAGPAARSPRPTSGRTASGRMPRASITQRDMGRLLGLLTASAPTSIWS